MIRDMLHIEDHKGMVIVLALGHYGTGLDEVRRRYEERGRFGLDFGEPEETEIRGKFFLAGNLYEPEPAHLTIIRSEAARPDSSFLNYGLGNGVVSITEDFIESTGFEPSKPDLGFLEVMCPDIIMTKAMYETCLEMSTPELARFVFRETIRRSKQYRPVKLQ